VAEVEEREAVAHLGDGEPVDEEDFKIVAEEDIIKEGTDHTIKVGIIKQVFHQGTNKQGRFQRDSKAQMKIDIGHLMSKPLTIFCEKSHGSPSITMVISDTLDR